MADGETLWGIARRYDVTVDAVREANNMDSETVRIGQTLRIPRAASGSSSATAGATRAETATTRTGTTASGTRTESGATSSRAPGERAASTARPSSSTTPSTSRPARAREHTVADGETLWSIARRYETTVDSLRRANDLGEDAQIRPGQKLSIPAN